MVFITCGVLPFCQYPRKMKRHFPIKPGQLRGIRLLPFFIPFPNSLHKWREAGQWTGLSKTERQISVGPVGRDHNRTVFIWLWNEISGIFGVMESKRGPHVLMHCSTASEVMRSSFFKTEFLPITQIFQDVHFPILLLNYQFLLALGKVNFFANL